MELVLVRPPVDEPEAGGARVVGDREARSRRPGRSARTAVDQLRPRVGRVGADAVVLEAAFAAEKRDVSGFVRHGADTTAETGHILSSNDEGRTCPRAARGAAGPRLGDRAGTRRAARQTDVRTLRRDVTALRALGIPVEGERGPRRLLPAQARLPRPAADVHHRRGGRGHARADGRPPPRPRGRQRARQGPPRAPRPRAAAGRVAGAHARLHGRGLEAAPPDGEILLTLADAARRGRRVHAPATATTRAPRPTATFSPYGVVSHHGRWYVPAFDDSRAGAARAAGRPRR